ncbi:MAG: hypothetical protein GY913_17210 [Proteobacteria bacterium]|nr:hypothetical protein [Pseudomonadota bacterium]MCP4918645.1 hypothetical protein [Pseudomonadota bacterium]
MSGDTPDENVHPDQDDAAPKGPADRIADDVGRGLAGLGKLASGIAGKVLGPGVDIAREPERTVVTPEVDAAIEKTGEIVGHWLRSAGDALKDHPADPGVAIDEALKTAEEKPKSTTADEAGWSPLVQGVKVFGQGLSTVAGEVFDVLADGASRTPQGSGEE